MRTVALVLIRSYQKTVSPDHGLLRHRHPYGYCRHYPSCSEYAYQTIAKQGFIKGSYKSVWRILRCNPFTEPCVDMPNQPKENHVRSV